MVGSPKYDYGDIVNFEFNDGIKQGIIAIIDRYGTFFDDSDVSYDILNIEEKTLYKHCQEKLIIEQVGHTDEDIWKLL